MRVSSFGYLIKQGAKNVFINRMMSLACVGVMMACLLIIGVAVILSVNVASMFDYMEAQNEVIAFVREGVSDERAAALGETVGAVPNVVSYTYISKEQALADERESFGDLAELLDGLEEDNPLPASYRIVLRDLDQIDATVAELNRIAEFETINAPIELSHTISAIQKILFYICVTIVVLLLLVTLIILSNTVKLTIFSHRREINIMKYCGATDSYIRLPFLIEGTIVGLTSSLLSYGIVYILYERLFAWLTTSEAQTGFLQQLAGNLVPFSQMALPLAAIFLAYGLLIGLLGSFLFTKRHLKV